MGKNFPDLETYLDIHFRLLMEDFLFPLRESFDRLASLNRGKRLAGVRIYQNARFESSLVNLYPAVPDRVSSWKCYRVHFQPHPHVRWVGSKRLIHGSLVCLWDRSESNISSLIVATVASSNSIDLADGQVTLAISGAILASDFLKREYLMIESSVFYEPYRAVLEALQSFDYDSFPMIDYILGMETRPDAPIYLRQCTSYSLPTGSSMKTISDVTNVKSWLSPDHLGLDERQHQALVAALTRRLSLIQGPPGTGKTYLGIY